MYLDKLKNYLILKVQGQTPTGRGPDPLGEDRTKLYLLAPVCETACPDITFAVRY
jgi:hypothetical protein